MKNYKAILSTNPNNVFIINAKNLSDAESAAVLMVCKTGNYIELDLGDNIARICKTGDFHPIHNGFSFDTYSKKEGLQMGVTLFKNTPPPKLEELSHNLACTGFRALSVNVARNYGYTTIISQKWKNWKIVEGSKVHYIGLYGCKRTYAIAKRTYQKYNRTYVEYGKLWIVDQNGFTEITFSKGRSHKKEIANTSHIDFLKKIPKNHLYNKLSKKCK